MKKKTTLLTALLAFAFISCAHSAEFARIGTSSVGGGFFIIGNTIAQMGNATQNGVNYTAVTGGSIKNLNALAKGDIEFGLCQSATMDEGLKGSGAFKKPLTMLRFVTAIYPIPAHILVSGEGIASIPDLIGKRIDFGPIGGGIDTNTRLILSAYGISDNDVHIDRYGKSESVEAIQTGTVNGHFWLTTVPNAQITEMLTKNVRLLPIEEEKRNWLVEKYPYFSKSVIPAGAYAGYDADLPVIAAVSALVTSESVSDELVYKTVKAMYENAAQLRERLPNYFAQFTLEHALDGKAGMEVHPGALKYYKEVGLIK